MRVRVSPTAPKRKENLNKFLKKHVFFRFTVLELCSSLCSDMHRMSKLKKFYQGDLSLGESFWIYLIYFNFVFKLTAMLLGQLGQLIYLIIIIKSVWEFFAVIGVWKSANKYIEKGKKKHWGYTAQMFALGQLGETFTFIWWIIKSFI